MTVPAISTRELSDLIKSSSLGVVLARLDAKRVESEPRSTIAQRQAAMAEALETLDDEQLLQYQETLSNYVDALAKAEVSFAGSGADLTPAQKVYLMRRYLDTKVLKELSKTVEAGLKRIVGEMVTAQVAAEQPTEPHPEHVSGSVEVPELGKRFCKEGAGRAPALIDLDELRRQLGEDLWAEVTETVEVPAVEAHLETRLSDVLLLAKAMTDPDVMTKLEASMIDGGWKSWKFIVRDIK